jgi:hypothetical protein
VGMAAYGGMPVYQGAVNRWAGGGPLRQSPPTMGELEPLAVVQSRLHAQRLASGHFDAPAEAVHWLGAMDARAPT